jgi:NADH dehydrogenase FAD-containing subunit
MSQFWPLRASGVYLPNVDAKGSTMNEILILGGGYTGQTLAEFQIPDRLAGTGVDFIQGWVTGIDAGTHTVRIDDAHTLRYDTLVFAIGSVADTAAAPGVDEFTYTLNSAHRTRACSPSSWTG